MMPIVAIEHGTLLDAVVSLWIPVLITATASIYIAKLARQARKTMDTGNNKDLGETVHDIAQTVEVLMAQVHTNTNETLEARKHAMEARERVDDWIRESSKVHEELLRRLPPS